VSDAIGNKVAINSYDEYGILGEVDAFISVRSESMTAL